MSTGDMLLQSILEAPEEDTPRLAYADWLDEQDDPVGHDHAELIRTQIELMRTPEMVEQTAPCSERDWYFIDPKVRKHKQFCLTDPANRMGIVSWGTAPNPQHVELHKKSTELRQKVAVPLVLDLCRACNFPTRYDETGCYVHICYDGATHLEKYSASPGLRWTFTRGFVSGISLPLRMYCEADLAAIWSKYPITKVDFPDRVPGGTIGGSAYWSSDDDSGVVRVNAVLPERLHRLTGRCHKTREVAVEKLSQAAVSLGRECARNAKQAVVAKE